MGAEVKKRKRGKAMTGQDIPGRFDFGMPGDESRQIPVWNHGGV